MQQYLGELSPFDPLYHLLSQTVLVEVLGLAVETPIFDVYSVDTHGVIFRYLERSSGVELACKFYGNRPPPGEPTQIHFLTAERLRREFASLQRVWELGFSRPPFRVVRPLAYSEAINYVLVEEFVAGDSLDTYLKDALHWGAGGTLYQRLTDLAAFLATLHQRSQVAPAAALAAGPAYLGRVVEQLARLGVLDEAQRHRLDLIRDGWAADGGLAWGPLVLVHGDVTPMNVVFRGPGEVVALDLERLREDDAAVDLGIVIAELRHAFLRSTHSSAGAEPLVCHFFERYLEARRPDPAEAARLRRSSMLTAASMMLRICRNSWLDMDYRRALCIEAERALAAA